MMPYMAFARTTDNGERTAASYACVFYRNVLYAYLCSGSDELE